MSAEGIIERNQNLIKERLNVIHSEIKRTHAKAYASATAKPNREKDSRNAIGKLSRIFKDINVTEEDNLVY